MEVYELIKRIKMVLHKYIYVRDEKLNELMNLLTLKEYSSIITDMEFRKQEVAIRFIYDNSIDDRASIEAKIHSAFGRFICNNLDNIKLYDNNLDIENIKNNFNVSLLYNVVFIDDRTVIFYL